ncbi:MAG: ATP-binding cassette domain-containing protein [Paludibacteraceae bacterium]|nr:ATP-binding cassette domain-containing protein [Paludibacteraceae bacterium]MEE1183800.1 ATP-binding cassette domain-containing protein [Paludibacteraceae bacterium]
MSLQVSNLSKRYGTQQVLTDLSFSVDKGQIVGFLGPNGAGKSTTMKIAMGFCMPDAGRVIVDGLDAQKDRLAVQRLVGYLPEHNPLYLDMYVRESLTFTANLYQLGNQTASRVDEMIERTGLSSECHKKIGQLSKGYRQRVGLAQALIHNPKVLILDEPTTGLDPNQLVDIRNLIQEFGKERTVLFSTHIMQEVTAICDRFLVLRKGELVADRAVDGLSAEQLETLFRELTA